MLVRKTYKCKIYARMQTYVNVKGKTVLVEFKPSRKNNVQERGTFSTAIPELIEAMEKDSGYNVLFELISTDPIEQPQPETLEVRVNPLDVKKQMEQDEAKAKAEIEQQIKNEGGQPKEVTVVPGEKIELPDVKPEPEAKPSFVTVPKDKVATVQQAKEYIKATYPEISYRQLINKEAILAIAKQKAIIFEALI